MHVIIKSPFCCGNTAMVVLSLLCSFASDKQSDPTFAAFTASDRRSFTFNSTSCSRNDCTKIKSLTLQL